MDEIIMEGTLCDFCPGDWREANPAVGRDEHYGYPVCAPCLKRAE